jgi:hypothetical protein
LTLARVGQAQCLSERNGRIGRYLICRFFRLGRQSTGKSRRLCLSLLFFNQVHRRKKLLRMLADLNFSGTGDHLIEQRPGLLVIIFVHVQLTQHVDKVDVIW